MRIAIVNDDNNHLLILKHIVSSMQGCEVAWTASNGKYAVEKSAMDTPDLILMDLIMPVMNGVEATKHIMASTPCAILIVTASVTSNAAMVFNAMGAGAIDAVNTPVLNDASKTADSLEKKINTIRRLVQTSAQSKPVSSRPAESTCIVKPHHPLVAIGTSTGGPAALSYILSNMPPDISAPIAIVQHVDQYFSNSLAQWLNSQTELEVCIAQGGEIPEPGKAYLAATGYHMIIMEDGKLGYTDKPEDIVYKPSVDVFFKSVAANWRGSVVAALLTGMGRDGARGLLAISNSGGYTLAQDEKSSTVFGMPKAAIEIGATSNVFDLKDIPAILLKNTKTYAKVGS